MARLPQGRSVVEVGAGRRQARRAAPALGGDGDVVAKKSGGQFHAEEIGHQFGQAILRQQLINGDAAVVAGHADDHRRR